MRSWTERNEFARLDDLAIRQLDLYVAALESELLHYADFPSLLEIDPAVSALLKDTTQPSLAVRAQASRSLEKFAARAGTREIFVLDPVGNVLAASDNYSSLVAPPSLSGISCAAALTGRARGFQFNQRTAAPEYYFVQGVGTSIAEPGVLKGCIVVKISLAPMESTWVDFSFRPESEKILVLDEHDVIILSSVPYWRYKTTSVFSAEKPTARPVAANPATYPTPTAPLAIQEQRRIGRGALLVNLASQAKRSSGQDAIQYVAHSRKLASSGWQVVLLSSPQEVWDNVRTTQFAALTILAFLGLLALYFSHRRTAVQQLLLARNALQRAHDGLEVTVAHRTQELRAANAGLLHEMQERQQAEEALLQANKMAMLGQMSAKISHEVSQPLTALRALAKNSRAFLERQQWLRVDENLKTMIEIVIRMSDITRQLRVFSGKTKKQSLQHHALSLNQAMRNAQVLLQERFEREQVTLTLPGQSLQVRGDSTQLEQVFVNLFSNALDAVELMQEKHIEVEVRAQSSVTPSRVVVCVRDSGPGIAVEMQAHLFEPFYTSKPSGKGLGLGLVICANIIHEHGGQLQFENGTSGAQFVFDLERAEANENERSVYV